MFDPMELVRAAHEAAAELALHRARTFLHQVFQQLSEAEADLLIAAEASFALVFSVFAVESFARFLVLGSFVASAAFFGCVLRALTITHHV